MCKDHYDDATEEELNEQAHDDQDAAQQDIEIEADFEDEGRDFGGYYSSNPENNGRGRDGY
jgi:hypothetical protein